MVAHDIFAGHDIHPGLDTKAVLRRTLRDFALMQEIFIEFFRIQHFQ